MVPQMGARTYTTEDARAAADDRAGAATDGLTDREADCVTHGSPGDPNSCARNPDGYSYRATAGIDRRATDSLAHGEADSGAHGLADRETDGIAYTRAYRVADTGADDWAGEHRTVCDVATEVCPAERR